MISVALLYTNSPKYVRIKIHRKKTNILVLGISAFFYVNLEVYIEIIQR